MAYDYFILHSINVYMLISINFNPSIKMFHRITKLKFLQNMPGSALEYLVPHANSLY